MTIPVETRRHPLVGSGDLLVFEVHGVEVRVRAVERGSRFAQCHRIGDGKQGREREAVILVELGLHQNNTVL